MNILILGAGVMQIPAIQEAKKMGHFVLCADGNPNALGKELCDIFYPVDLKDKQGLLEVAEKFNDKHTLHGVFTAGTDFSSSVAFITEKLGLPGIPYQSSLNATDKVRMRMKFEENSVPSPKFVEFSDGMDLKRSIEDLTFPLVVKPVDSMGARGVKRVNNLDELTIASKDALEHSRTGRAIIEEYIEGSEFSLDALVIDNEVKIFGFADRKINFEPYFVEMGHTMPSNISEEDKERVIEVFSKGVKALGINYGSAKGDMKLGKNGPVIGEIAARLSGGYMSGWTYPYSSGVNLMKGGIELALGLDVTISDENNNGGYSAERAVISIPGIVESIVSPVKKPKGINDIFLGIKKGDTVRFPENNVQKCGNVISVGTSYESAVKCAENCASDILIRLKSDSYETQEFLFGNNDKVSPRAFDIEDTDYLNLDETVETDGKIIYIKRLDKILKSRKKDWHNRTVNQVLKKISDYYKVEFVDDSNSGADFYQALINGTIQGVLYYLDGLEI